MLYERDYVSLELAKKLKEAGYKDATAGKYCLRYEAFEPSLEINSSFNGEYYAAPTLYEAMMWLRTKHVVLRTNYVSSLDYVCFYAYKYNIRAQWISIGKAESQRFEYALAYIIEKAVDYLIEQRNEQKQREEANKAARI